MWESMLRLFGDKLRKLRLHHGLAQADLARRLGTSRAQLNNLEAGRRDPAFMLAIQVSNLFSVSLDYLLRDTIPMEASEASTSIKESDRPLSSLQFGQKLRYLRLREGKTQEEIARQLGLASGSHISFLEAGRKTPSISLTISIADVFHVSVDYLLRDDILVESLSL